MGWDKSCVIAHNCLFDGTVLYRRYGVEPGRFACTQALTRAYLPFDRTEEGDLAFSLAGDWKDYELWFAWREEAGCLQLCLALDLRVPSAMRPGRLAERIRRDPPDPVG